MSPWIASCPLVFSLEIKFSAEGQRLNFLSIAREIPPDLQPHGPAGL